MNVLVVDDDPVQRQIASVALSFAGCRMAGAANVREGLERLAASPFDIVLLDHDMPGGVGFDLLIGMSAAGRLAETPVIYVTSRDDALVIDRAFELGASGFVTKPVNWTSMPHHMRFVVRAARNERTAAAARDEALRLSETRRHLLTIVRHELRTPLNAILGFGRVAREALAADHPAASAMGEAMTAADLLRRRVDDMMLCLDLESGAVAPRPEAEDALALLEDCLSGWARRAGERGLALDLSSPPERLMVRVDARHLADMIGRLIENVLAHAPAARRIAVRVAREEEGRVSIAVVDDGDGIAPERLAECRDAFRQLSNGDARRGEGLGLGLHIVEGLARVNGGAFRLDSEGPGRGVSATISLPAD